MHNGIFRGLAEFSIGLSLGALFVAPGNEEPRVGRCACARQRSSACSPPSSRGTHGAAPPAPRDLMVALPIVAPPFVLAFDRGLLAELLHASWLRILGEWAFVIYMVHFAVLVGMFTAKLISASWPGLVAGTGSCILEGGLTWRFVEQPLGEVMRRRLNREPRDR